MEKWEEVRRERRQPKKRWESRVEEKITVRIILEQRECRNIYNQEREERSQNTGEREKRRNTENQRRGETTETQKV